MTFAFRPASSFTDRFGLFVGLSGGTSSGKTFSALRLARGIAGPKGRIAVLDTEGGRTLHLKDKFQFDAVILDPPHRPERYAEAARDAEAAGYDVLVIDSFSMEWVGLGGVLDWQAEEFTRMGSREAVKLASWIKPKMSHKAMVYSFLQRRMPIVFALRAEDKAKKDGSAVKSEWAPICNKAFPFEVTVSFMLMQDRQGFINLELPHKLEGDHKPIFQHGQQLSEAHGAALAAWATGSAPTPEPTRAAAPLAGPSDPGPAGPPSGQSGLPLDPPKPKTLKEAYRAAMDGIEKVETASDYYRWLDEHRAFVDKLKSEARYAESLGEVTAAMKAAQVRVGLAQEEEQL